jgi:hypothetical protein
MVIDANQRRFDMGLMDKANDMKDKASESGDSMKRIQELKKKQDEGTLTDSGREELTQLRQKMGK